MMKRLILALGLLAGVGLASTSRADIIYSFSTTLRLVSGPDTMLLDGASAELTFKVVDGSVYVERFGFPAVAVVDPTLTISGSGLAANNVSVAVEPTAFYPSFAGFFSEPGGIFSTATLGGGDLLELRGNTSTTATGGSAVVGGTPLASDFAPASYTGSNWRNLTDSSEYELIETVIRASGSVGVVPEPTSLALVAVGLVGVAALARRRRA